MKSQEIETGDDDSGERSVAEILAPLSFFEKAFIAKYISSGFNGAAAYRASGRVVEDYTGAAAAIIRRPTVRKAIDELISPHVISAVELLILVSNIAKYSLNDYNVTETEIVQPTRSVDVKEYVAIYKKSIDFEYMYVDKLSDNGRDVKDHYRKIDRMEDELNRLEIEAVLAPETRYTVTEHLKEVTRERFDYTTMVRSGDRVQIQEIHNMADGSVKVKGYSSSDAQEKLMKFYGRYEKDNKQSAVKIKITNKKDK